MVLGPVLAALALVIAVARLLGMQSVSVTLSAFCRLAVGGVAVGAAA
jgi:hypothetical protein